ncbi:MAG: hypothetical protein GXP42_15515 [Chloroflexi bacterium]|nr:hypothetical protein [Chloroflexota bacterium]
MAENRSPEQKTLTADQFTFDEDGNLVIKDDEIVEALRSAPDVAGSASPEEAGVSVSVTIGVSI